VTAPASVAWIGLGANIGRREANLARMRDRFDRHPVHIAAASRELVTRPIGPRAQPDYLNQVLRVGSQQSLRPEEWLTLCREAETATGRRPTYRWGPRRGDADILVLGERGQLRVDQRDLVVPHPELANRPFECALLAELDPELEHPDGWRYAERAGIFVRQ
jgi:2-amino-4-hydroxy-6-hydroxymethyldihydropteridine diphosphokinase